MFGENAGSRPLEQFRRLARRPGADPVATEWAACLLARKLATHAMTSESRPGLSERRKLALEPLENEASTTARRALVPR